MKAGEVHPLAGMEADDMTGIRCECRQSTNCDGMMMQSTARTVTPPHRPNGSQPFSIGCPIESQVGSKFQLWDKVWHRVRGEISVPFF